MTEAAPEMPNQSAVEINDTVDDNSDQDNGISYSKTSLDLPNENEEEQELSPEKQIVPDIDIAQDTSIFEKRSMSDQLDDIPKNVVLDSKDVSNIKGSAKKKGKSKHVPKAIKRVFPNCSDVSMWRKRNRLEKHTKVFKMIGNYSSIKSALTSRGWVENKDKSSPCYDLLWTLKQRDIDYENLKDGQIVNHFKFNGVITTKVGLCRNLGKVIHFNNVDIDTFFPK